MNKSKLIPLLLVAVFSSTLTLATYKIAGLDKNLVIFEETNKPNTDNQNLIKLTKKERLGELDLTMDFTEIAAKTTSSVVHITTTQNNSTSQGNRRSTQEMPDIFREFFGDQLDGGEFRRMPQGPIQASGSGVIISKDGYIVTNNHVVGDASDIEVVLQNKQSYKATLVGVDPSTDLAVIKIEANDLPNLALGNSDEVKVGQWVLAVGNPFNLESTVTAGIISAKGRNLNILRDKDQAPIESFIQTDAAVNPGNSGGALINTQGELIGINTAIATPTGTFAGYSFAVPVNLVRKVMKDLIEYGQVQRGYLGISIREIDGKFAEEKGLKNISEGVYIQEVMPQSAAADAGLKAGDIIIGLEGKRIKSSPELLEEVAKRRPGNKINLELIRNGTTKKIDVFLKGKIGETEIATRPQNELLRDLGIDLEEVSPEECKELGIKSGLKVTGIYPGKIRSQTNMREGFIITKMADENVKSVEDFLKKVENQQGGVLLSGTYENASGLFYYGFGM
jgi:Do/DeqQ family serine protease